MVQAITKRAVLSGHSMPQLEEEEELGTGAKGKRGELIVIGELLSRGFKVYLPQVDTGIDCIVDVGDGNYREVQIKYREKTPIFTARDFRPRDNFFFICWLVDSRGTTDYWIIPSPVFHHLARESKVNQRDYLQLAIGKEGNETYNQLAQYHHTFGALLEGASHEVKKQVSKASSARVRGVHLTGKELEYTILSELNGLSKPLEAKGIIERLAATLGRRFEPADLEVDTEGRPRWERNARFMIYQHLKRNGMIEAKSKNQWTITNKGRKRFEQLRTTMK